MTSPGHEFKHGYHTVVVQKWEQVMLLQVNYLKRKRRNLIYVLKNGFYRKMKGRGAHWGTEYSQHIKCLGDNKRHVEKSEDGVMKWSVCQNREFELYSLGSGVPWDVLGREADLRKPVFGKDNWYPGEECLGKERIKEGPVVGTLFWESSSFHHAFQSASSVSGIQWKLSCSCLTVA